MRLRLDLLALSLFVGIVLVLHSSGIFPIRLLTELEYQAYDTRLRSTMPGGVDPRIVIIDINEDSLAELGAWPWSREVMAQMTQSLFDYGVEVV